MTKYITVKLTTEQANFIANTFSYDGGEVQNNDYPRSDQNNAFIERIRTKIVKQLAQAKSKVTS